MLGKVRITRVLDLSESEMRGCYNVLQFALPVLVERFYCNAMCDINGHHKNTNYILYAAKSLKGVVGLLEGGVTNDVLGNYAYIQCLCVYRNYRGRGIGSYLLKAYEDCIRKDYSAGYVCLDSAEDAVKFYNKHGYYGNALHLSKSISR